MNLNPFFINRLSPEKAPEFASKDEHPTALAPEFAPSVRRLLIVSPNQEWRGTLASYVRSLLPVFLTLACTAAAHAQGTIDFSGANTLMGSFKTFAIYAGAIICFIGLIFAGIKMMSGRFQEAIPGLFGALFGAGVLGWGAGWISSLTGQSVQ